MVAPVAAAAAGGSAGAAGASSAAGASGGTAGAAGASGGTAGAAGATGARAAASRTASKAGPKRAAKTRATRKGPKHAAKEPSTRVRRSGGAKHAAKGQAGRDAKQMGKMGLGYALGRRRGRRGKRGKPARSGPSRALVAEFLICVVILALSPMADREGDTSPRDWMKRGTAVAGLFFLLGLLSAAGPRAARTSVAIGGLVTVALLVDRRGIFPVLASKLKTTGSGPVPEVGPPDEGQDEGTGRIGRRIAPGLWGVRPRETRP